MNNPNIYIIRYNIDNYLFNCLSITYYSITDYYRLLQGVCNSFLGLYNIMKAVFSQVLQYYKKNSRLNIFLPIVLQYYRQEEIINFNYIYILFCNSLFPEKYLEMSQKSCNTVILGVNSLILIKLPYYKTITKLLQGPKFL